MVRRALRERVARKVAGSGISPRSIERAVDAVVAALPPDAGVASSGDEPQLIAAISARSVPDLGSRIRAGLQKEGIAPPEIAVATAGQHTVVTLRVPARAHDSIARIAAAQKATFTVIDGAGVAVPGARS